MLIRRALCAALLGVFVGAVQAQAAPPATNYPTQPIRMVLPLSPGTTTDLVARMFGERLGQLLGQPVIIDNRPGAGGTLAAQAVAKAPADGYTILLVNSQHAINPAAHVSLPYDTLRDFTGLAMVAEAPSVIAVSRELGVNTLAEFVALAKKKPGSINYGSAGVGSQTHLAGAYFASKAGIQLTHVPYRSGSDVISDFVTNRIQSVFVPAPFVMGHIKDGKVKALAVTGPSRLPQLPNVPTVAESAIPGYNLTTWFGFVAPAKTPAPIAALLAKTFKAIAEEPDIKQKFLEQGLTTRILVQRDFDALIKSEVERLGPIAKTVGVDAK
ncbi:MAG: tripartite tricarboxylate transporter substrate binding protein [Rhizobacter sp.]